MTDPGPRDWLRLSRGDLLALLGIAIFAGTYPATKFVLAGGISPWQNTWWRAAIAGILAAFCLRIANVACPQWRTLRQVSVLSLALGVVFPLGLSWALQHIPSAHAAVVLAALPLATVAYAQLRGYGRQSARFWWGGLIAAGLVAVFAWRHAPQSSSGIALADLALVIAIAGAAVGYVEGGRLCRELPGWQVISWALVVLLPLSLPVALWLAWPLPPVISTPAWLGLAYGAVFSMYLAFFPWYAALTRIGVPRASQLQYLQPFVAIGYGLLLLDEHLAFTDLLLALGVVGAIAWGRGKGSRRAS